MISLYWINNLYVRFSFHWYLYNSDLDTLSCPIVYVFAPALHAQLFRGFPRGCGTRYNCDDTPIETYQPKTV